MLKTNNITKRFGSVVAVDDVSIEISDGDIVGLIGPNGAGKTTLFNVITGFHRPSNGTVTYRDEDITNLKPHQITQKGIVRTFQVPKPLNDLTVTENVVVGAFGEGKGREAALAQAHETLDRVNFQGDYSMTADNLNVAQLKRLEIAKAVATDPDLLMLDEAVAGLNPEERNKLVNVIDKLNDEGITIFLVEHVMDVVMRLSDKVIVLNEGRVLTEGTPEEVQNNEEVVEVYLGT
ncbi:ABC-type branched-chain amino acid transport system, ATPase component [Halanaeroarchaeum sp. HSR-CO]|uniref:ABC transporter ATP-binding protein n=1 Tax=Halanaeroarchaeum sp. HSR-CO TaxID=2866382 RepID=UPI00217DD580|nr:ABC transporter ATP-binding protein [Halanaeroarchaeum sp. HSR-CO]UWG47086.1 ABC-type branched-chain amino acid transport system, ATPase component [Halanaeroarchaeum sp. HSR-CO]